MQRVFRSTLAGLLTIAGLTACGDKVTIPQQITPTPDGTIHAVLVSPSQLTLAVGGKGILAASVDAGPAATDRTVNWSSSDATVASVGTDGTVTGVKGGTVTITAASKQDPNIKGAAAVTVTGAVATGQPTISIASVNATNAFGQSVPANLALGVAGQIDVILNVDAGGQVLKTVSVSIKSGTDVVTQTQTLTAATAPAFAAEGAASTITFSFNTAAFNATTGVPALHNSAAATITASVTTTTSTTGGASSTITFVLANLDGVLITNAFAPYTNAEGVTTVTTANDAGGLPWRSGAVTVTALPVLYNIRTISSLSLTIPGALIATQTLTAAPYTATWSATSTSGSVPRVTQLTLTDPALFEVNGTTPKGITPTVIALDNVGNDLGLGVLNAGITGATFRLDNSAPQPPTSFVTAGRQAGWVNAAYTFTGSGGTSFTAATGTTKWVSCGDGPAATSPSAANCAGFVGAPAVYTLGTALANGQLVTAAFAGIGQVGVSTGAVGTNGTTGLTTFTYYSIPTASYPGIGTNGTSTSATTCSTTGFTKITTGNDLAGTLNNLAYVVRVFETDKLGNARCTDLANAANTINGGAFVNGTFGVDKIAPTAAYVDNSATNFTAASNLGIWNLASPAAAIAAGCAAGTVPSCFLVSIGLADDASQPSGFSATPVTTMVERLFVDPVTKAPSSFNTANGCPTGLSSGVCSTASAAASLPGWYNATAGALSDAEVAPATCNGCGYYAFFQTPLDNARNAAASLGANSAATTFAGPCTGFTGCRQVLIDIQAPVMGGIAVPATIVGGTTVAFSTSATDNLDLGTYDYSILYPQTILGSGLGATAPIRSPATATNGQTIGTSFDNVLTTSSSFPLQVPSFIRNLESTTAGDAPQNNAVLPSQITGRVYDAAGNGGVGAASVVQLISAVNIPQAGRVDFAAAQPCPVVVPALVPPCATMTSFKVANAAAFISNGPASVTAVNPTVVTLSVTASGTESPTFQYINPFTSVQFYYLDPATSEFVLIGSSAASTVTDNAGVTVRTFTWNLSWDPPAPLGAIAGGVKIMAVGINAAGDALASQVNNAIILTNP